MTALQNTLQKIKDQMEDKQDFPLMSNTLKMLNKKASLDVTVSELTDMILHDFALTNKLLRMVNSVHFIKTHYSGKVNTISRAIYILGLDHVRNAAISLMLFDNIQTKDMANELKEALIVRFISGTTARQMGQLMGSNDTEEAFLCAMYHNLGQLLTIYYLPEEYGKIKAFVRDKKISEKEATKHILGISYENLGITIAKQWKMSSQIVYSMKSIPGSVLPKPGDHMEQMRTFANFSADLCRLISKTSTPQVWNKAVDLLINRYKNCFTLSGDKVNELIKVSIAEFHNYAHDYEIGKFPFIEKMSTLVTYPKNHTSESVKEPTSLESTALPVNEDINAFSMDAIEDSGKSPDDIFSRGIQDIASTLLDDKLKLNDVIRMILEVMYSAMDFSKVVIMIMNKKSQTLEGRFGYGDSINDFLPKFKAEYDKNSDDVFNMAINHGQELLINDIKNPQIFPYLPKWFLENIECGSFILMPIIINNSPVAIIYADKPQSGNLAINPRYIRYLRTLRNQAIMAIKQKQSSN